MNIRFLVINIFFLILGVFKGYSQEKRSLFPEDYKLLDSGKFTGSQISRNGKWICYKVDAKWYLKNVTTNQDREYTVSNLQGGDPLGKRGGFSPDNKWFSYQSQDTLYLVSLITSKVLLFPKVSFFTFTSGGYLLYLVKDAGMSTLKIKDLNHNKGKSIENVKEHWLNSSQTIVAFVTKENDVESVRFIKLQAGLPIGSLISNSEASYHGIVWSKNGTSIAFYEDAKNGGNKEADCKIFVCADIGLKPVLKELNSSLYENSLYPPPSKQWPELYLSDDGKQVFFYTHPGLIESMPRTSIETKTANKVVIWHSHDKKIPPRSNKVLATKDWCVWWPEVDKIVTIEDAVYPQSVLTGNQKYALVYNELKYLPQHDFVGRYIDLYIKNLETGHCKLLIEKLINDDESGMCLSVSPTGKYVTYYKEKNWWVYDIEKETHKCLTERLNATFENTEYDWAGAKPPYGHPGWLEGDNYLILYDRFDIWLISPDGSERKRVTDGIKSQITYRIHKDKEGNLKADRKKSGSFSLLKGILLTTRNSDLDEGLCYWQAKAGIKRLVQKSYKLSPLSKVDANRPFLFSESDFNLPPRLMLVNSDGKEQLVYQSSPLYKQFHLGKSELINYTSDGKSLKGALFYPANYEEGKQYPMIVQIYEKMSQSLHEYLAPSEIFLAHLNQTNYTLDGYFVLHPDIAYEINEPGISATKCVVAAVEKVLERGVIDNKRVGLIGHSFGGYETSFIISQTNLFKTAIAGSGYMDLVGWYLGFHDGGSNIWKFENQQQRMQVPYYSTNFQRNSTIMNAQHINTPLLLWTGDKDQAVDWTESRKLQVALWRLGKKSTLLVYQGENHWIANKDNQVGLSRRLKNWFDYYLKGEKPADWMEIDTSVTKRP